MPSAVKAVDEINRRLSLPVRGFGLDQGYSTPSSSNRVSMVIKQESTRKVFPWGMNAVIPPPVSSTGLDQSNNTIPTVPHLQLSSQGDELSTDESHYRRDRILKQHSYIVPPRSDGIFDQESDFVNTDHRGSLIHRISVFLSSFFETRDALDISPEEEAEMGLIETDWNIERPIQASEAPSSDSSFPRTINDRSLPPPCGPSPRFINIPLPDDTPPPLPPLPQPKPCNFPLL
jgi:hypothetical protein